MPDWLRNLRYPPAFTHDEKARRAEILHYGSILIFISTIILFWINLKFGTQTAKEANWLLALVASLQIFIQWMIRSGYVNAASLTLLTVGWVCMTAISRLVGGIYDQAIFGYVLVLLASGYLLGWRVAAAYTIFSIAAIWWLAYLEDNRLFKPDIGRPYQNALDLTVVFLLILLVVFFIARTLTNALTNAQNELSVRVAVESEREELIAQLSEEITARKRIEKELQRLASTDPLTGLFNRRRFLESAKQEFIKSSRYKRPLSLIMLDLDWFKSINDAFGHPAGDRVLVQVAALLRNKTREVDVAARFGGEEFIILLPETDSAGAQVLAERLRCSIENLLIENDNGTISLTVSIGIANKNSNVETINQLIAQADSALYAAKSAGRNRIICCSD